MPSSWMSKPAAGLAEDVEEGEHLLLLRAADEDLAIGRERGGGPGRGLVAVEDRPVVVAAELLDALDHDDAVRLVGDDRAHLLQHGDQVHDLGLDGGVAQLRDALGAHGREEHLLGGTDAGVREVDVRPVQAASPPWRGGCRWGASRRSHRTCAERPRWKSMGAVTDAASTEVGDERLTETVQQRAAEEDRNARGTGVSVDLLEVRGFHVARVEHQRTGLIAFGTHAHRAPRAASARRRHR
jgi:hypothetical protein